MTGTALSCFYARRTGQITSSLLSNTQRHTPSQCQILTAPSLSHRYDPASWSRRSAT